jgi:tetratricopeptide (TPR) repeat protein
MSQNYSSAVRSYTAYIERRSFTPYRADAYYGRGMSYMGLKDYPRAAADLQKAADEAGDRALRAQALYRLGQASGQCGDFAKAEASYRRLLGSSQAAVGRDELNYLLGLACLRQGKWEEAGDQFRTVVRTYPSSSYRALAEEKLANRDRFFTVQVGAYSTMSAAEARLRQLAAFGQQPFIRTVTRQGVTYYCVRTGRFTSRNAARQYLNILYSTGITDAMVVP